MARVAALAVLAAAAAMAAPPSQPLATQYRISLHFGNGKLAATAAVSLRAPARTEALNFGLASGLEPGDLATGGQTYRPLRVAPEHYRVLLVTPWAAGSEQRIVLHYGGTPPAPDRIAPRQIALLPGTGWFPRFAPASRFRSELRFAPPPGLRAVARGEWVGTDSRGVETWRDPDVATALGLILAPVAERDFVAPGMTISAFAADPAALRPLAARIDRARAILAAHFGRPYYSVSDLKLASLPGLDFSAAAGNLLIVPNPPPPAPALTTLRELAAAWWDRPGTPAWLVAGLETTTALDLLAAEDGPGARSAWLPRLQARAQSAPPESLLAASRRAAAGALPASDHAVMAARATLVLNALRLEIGDDAFVRLLRAWARTPSTADAASAGGAAFEAVAASAAARDLGWFWRQWLDRPSLPRIDFEWRTVHLPRSGQTVRVRVRQPSPPYDFRAPILIVAGGRRYFQFIDVRNGDTILGIPVRGPVDSVQFDPGQELLRAAAPGA